MKASTIELIWGKWKNVSERNEDEPEDGKETNAMGFIDYRIDGQLLSSTLDLDVEEGSMIGTLGWGWRSIEGHQKHARMFLLEQPADLESGRFSLYVCPLCGDSDCGGVTINIKKTQHYFIWSDFAYEDYYTRTTPSFAPYKDIGPFYFDLYHYHYVLNLYIHSIPHTF